MPLKIAMVVTSLAVVGSIGCAVQTQDGGDPSAVSDTSEALTVTCDLSRAHILASVGADRAEAIQRGFGWYDARVPYNQSSEPDSRRQVRRTLSPRSGSAVVVGSKDSP